MMLCPISLGLIINSDPKVTKITVYPNPAGRLAYFTFITAQNQIVKLEIFNLQGKAIANASAQTHTKGEHSITFDTSVLPPGIYFYRLTAGSQAVNGTVVVQR
jgi:hypothetical protein